MNKLTEEQISDVWNKADNCRGDKRFLAYDVFNLIIHAQHLGALLKEKDKALERIAKEWNDRDTMRNIARKALNTSSNNEGEI